MTPQRSPMWVVVLIMVILAATVAQPFAVYDIWHEEIERWPDLMRFALYLLLVIWLPMTVGFVERFVRQRREHMKSRA